MASAFNKDTAEQNSRQVQSHMKTATARIHLECRTACKADYATQEASLMNFTQDLKEGGELELDPPALRAIYNHSSPAGPTWAQELLIVEAEITITPKEIQMADPEEPLTANLLAQIGTDKYPGSEQCLSPISWKCSV
uniref:Uncharacterized protein n=1 Tax=Sphaerodactylus townsendi TaxID=933632 RepID=A0ACB8FFQ4_9SAUR